MLTGLLKGRREVTKSNEVHWSLLVRSTGSPFESLPFCLLIVWPWARYSMPMPSNTRWHQLYNTSLFFFINMLENKFPIKQWHNALAIALCSAWVGSHCMHRSLIACLEIPCTSVWRDLTISLAFSCFAW